MLNFLRNLEGTRKILATLVGLALTALAPIGERYGISINVEVVGAIVAAYLLGQGYSDGKGKAPVVAPNNPAEVPPIDAGVGKRE
jgi:hypothetical protein